MLGRKLWCAESDSLRHPVKVDTAARICCYPIVFPGLRYQVHHGSIAPFSGLCNLGNKSLFCYLTTQTVEGRFYCREAG